MKVKKRKKVVKPKTTQKVSRKKPQKIRKKIDKKIDKVLKENAVYKTAEFNAYVLWKTLPASLRCLKDEELEIMGLKDDLIMKLLKMRNQSEFAEEYKIRMATLSDWNKRIYEKNLIFESIGIWAKAMTPSIMMAMGSTALKRGEAKEVLAWVKIIDGWSDKSQVDINASEELTKALQKVNTIIPD